MELVLPMCNVYPCFSCKNLGKREHYTRQKRALYMAKYGVILLGFSYLKVYFFAFILKEYFQ